MSDQEVSRDWPAGVHPPGAESFEQTALVWLFEQVPADYRLHGVLRRHPLALARLARLHVTACLENARQAYRTTRADLGDWLPTHAVDQVMRVYLTEGQRLAATLRAVEAVEAALRASYAGPRGS
ncbi:hypothetical protein [Salinactinospora qingdaonensis]|uniref:Uncharacterized protein n=1 Tax=Salinactinospora qingdaonensis TaxID=702744 RepID=A0ABP7G4K8_9ACTN